MSRRDFPSKVRLAAFERCGGRCEKCGMKVIGRAEFDHILPDGLGGEPTLENCQCLCSKCHRLKTSTQDIPRIAKTKRAKAKSVGATKPKQPFPGGKASKWKRTVDGRTVAR